MSEAKNARLRALPSVDEVLGRPSLEASLERYPRPRVVAAVRRALEVARQRLLGGEALGFEDADVQAALEALGAPGLGPVLNATGVVLHTNLGRAPLAAAAVERVAQVAAGYCNLEYDLDEGERGSRWAPLVGPLRELTGAEDALVVNNCAGAVLLALTALGAGREAVVSRGELVEIGGGFRIPDVIRQSGVRLVEVGTTNRTRIADYQAAVTSQTAVLLKVHKSNFAQVGFTEEVSVPELAALGQAHGLIVFEDLGSGSLRALDAPGAGPDRAVRLSIQEGADLCAFSADKLLGGPQAGILVGRHSLVDAIAKHPLHRALRVDKMTVAALEATLELYRNGQLDQVPAQRLLRQTPEQLLARAQRLHALLLAHRVACEVTETVSQVGGGALPLAELRSYACALRPASLRALQKALREGRPPVVTRLSEEQLLLDVRCLEEEDLPRIAARIGDVTQP